MASPYILLALAPRTARILPKPGQWMVQLKIVLGFLLIAAAVWLLYVLGSQLGNASLAFIQLGLLGVALFIWAGAQTKSSFLKGVTRAATIASIAAVLFLAGQGRDNRSAQATPNSSGLISWQPFELAKVPSITASGKSVFVDVTADWCFTCKINKTLVLDSDAVGKAFRTFNVVAMRADWTNPDERIARFLGEFSRSGIPFYVLYRADGTTHVFSEILSVGEVIDVVSRSTDDR